MTDLVAEAIALCEEELWNANSMLQEPWKFNSTYEMVQRTINSWTTHLAEMDEHYNNFVEGNYNLTESTEGWFCQGCYERNETDTPCRKKVTKVKRLLGKE